MTDHAKRIWLHAIAIVAKARNKCAPGERFEALNLVMGDLEDARRRDQLIAPDFPAACPDCGQHCETHNGESDCAALQPGGNGMTHAARDVLAERQRQIERMTKELDEARAQAAALFPVGSRDGEAISSTILADMEKLK